MPRCDGFAGINSTLRPGPRVGFLVILVILGLPELGFRQKVTKVVIPVQE